MLAMSSKKAIMSSDHRSRLLKYFGDTRLRFVFVVIFYLFFTVMYMGPSTWNCKDTLIGFGDSTGGPIWRNSLKPSQPFFGGPEKMTNFPFGEDLYSPVGIVAAGQTLEMRTISKVVGPVCAYNAMNIIGFLSTAILMFWFVYYLTKRYWIGLVAGYIVSFTPYAQSKVGGHPSYGYTSLLILVFWAVHHLIKRSNIKSAAYLAIILACCFYFDPYFILLAGTVIAAILLAWIMLEVRSRNSIRDLVQKNTNLFKTVLVSIGMFGILVSPLVYTRVKSAALINAQTGAVRGDIEAAAMLCSNLPLDYLLPDPYNNNLVKYLGSRYTRTNIKLRHWCGPGESRVSISLTVMAVILLALVAIVWERLVGRKSRTIKIAYDKQLFITSVLFLAVISFLIGMPPRIHGVLMPSGLIIKATSTWRIFAREFLLLNFAAAVAFVLSLSYIYDSVKKYNYKRVLNVVLVVLFLCIALEYQVHDSFRPFNFSYTRDVPKIYRRIADDPEINAIAEYPLDRSGVEYDSVVYYLTMQVVHGKPILNSDVAISKEEGLHIGIKDLTDPQTLPVLRGLGIKYITIHGLTSEQVLAKTTQLEIIKEETPIVYGLTMVRGAPTNNIILAKIRPGVAVDVAVTLGKGFLINLDLMKTPIDMKYEVASGMELSTRGLWQKNSIKQVAVCFDVATAIVGDSGQLEVNINDRVLKTIPIDNHLKNIDFVSPLGAKITLRYKDGHNLVLDNIGCLVD